MSRLIASCICSGLLLTPLIATAEPQGPPAGSSGSGTTLDTIVVTGSYIRRTNSESPSPVTTIDADEITKSGLNSIADVIRTVSADNSGTLSQAFSGAMAGGADGVALRGLTVDATLVLVDGHRMAAYPLSDDGQRQFVDIDSLPMAIVDRVEVLKDGASATYGSDAIAGVVNVILKKQFTGVDLSATAGSTDRGDGLSQRFAATLGDGQSRCRRPQLLCQPRGPASAGDSPVGAGLLCLRLRSHALGRPESLWRRHRRQPAESAHHLYGAGAGAAGERRCGPGSDAVSVARLQRARTSRLPRTAAAAAPGTRMPTRSCSRAPRDSTCRPIGASSSPAAG